MLPLIRSRISASVSAKLYTSKFSAIRGGVMRINITRRDVCGNCHGNGYLESPGTCPQCKGKGTIEQTGGRMKFNVTCPRCHGTGKNISTCPVCHGEGTVERTDPLEVRIKAGTRAGQRIRISGRGNAGLRGGPAFKLARADERRIRRDDFLARERDRHEAT